ncbi:MAG: putative porin [Crocinitomicaceae bacterium]|jgi:hypothetical protein
MRNILSIFILILFFKPIQAQESFLFKRLDTINSSTSIAGKKLDSIDLIFAEKYTTTPGSFYTHPFGRYGNDYSSFFLILANQHRAIDISVFRYSAIPYLGAYYAFGSKGTQYLNIEYQQSFSKKTYFTLTYNRNVATGAFRFNSFANDFFSIGVLHKGKRWSHLVSAASLKQNRSLNGGVVSFNEIVNYGLEFANVRKQKTSDSIAQLEIKTETEFRFSKKDSTNRFAFVLNNKLHIDKRVFREQDSLTVWYPNEILFDSLKTRDLTQLSRLDNQFGIRYKKGGFRATFLMDKGYWLYRTFSYQIKNELDLLANFHFKRNNWSFHSENQLNLIGANSQSSFKLLINRKSDFYEIALRLNQINNLPNPMQRLYITNTLSYSLSELKLQHNQTAKIEFKTNAKQSIYVSLFGGNFQNQYFFLKNRWRNDTLRNISQLTFQIKGDFSSGIFHIQPNLVMNLVDKVQLIPKYDFRTRVFLSKGVKRKSTLFNIGIDLNYKSSYQLMTFDDRISLYKMDLNNSYIDEYTNLDVFASMQMDEFRMYFKVENIDNYWNSIHYTIAENYPVAPIIMRIGLTWDFFN